MHNNLLIDFLENIASLRNYICFLDDIDNFIQNNLSKNRVNKDLKKIITYKKINNKDSKIFEYSSIIISAYGIFEEYINDCIISYINSTSNLFNAYEDYPEKIRNNHFELSLKLANRIFNQESDPRYLKVKKEDIILNLSNCINDKIPYNLNAEAFIMNSGNYKVDKIKNAFNYLAIDLNLFLGVFFINPSTVKQVELLIDDLVERRNTVAHKANYEIADSSVLLGHINALEKYGEAIFQALAGAIASKEIDIKKAVKIKNIIKIYNKSILCFNINNIEIKKGDSLTVKRDGICLSKIINNIQVNKRNRKSIKIKNQSIDIAIQVAPTIKSNYEFYLVSR